VAKFCGLLKIFLYLLKKEKAMGDLEAKVGEKTIGENTKITLSVKVALWIISGIIVMFSSAFTYGYLDVTGQVNEYREQMEKDKSEFIQTVEKTLDEKLGVFQTKDEQFIKQIEEIKGDVKVILDRTAGIRPNASITNNNTPPQ